MAVARTATLCVLLLAGGVAAQQEAARDGDPGPPWVVYDGGGGPGKGGPGKGKHIVFVSGDEEYRSEEACPMLAKILAERHGFRCTVLFAIDPDSGEIAPDEQTNIPGLELLDSADLMVVFLRFRELPDADMAHFDAFVHSGKPIIGLRTATHAFRYSRHPDSRYVAYDFHSADWHNGFGMQVLGETWVAHHGHHGRESTRGVVNQECADHPVLRGVTDVWGPTDVYAAPDVPEAAQVLLWGQVLAGMTADAAPVEGPKNAPMMPLAWTRTFVGREGARSPVFCTTMGAATDFENAGLRRLFVNACYWGLGLDVPERADVGVVGSYEPSEFGFGGAKKRVTPADLR